MGGQFFPPQWDGQLSASRPMPGLRAGSTSGRRPPGHNYFPYGLHLRSPDDPEPASEAKGPEFTHLVNVGSAIDCLWVLRDRREGGVCCFCEVQGISFSFNHSRGQIRSSGLFGVPAQVSKPPSSQPGGAINHAQSFVAREPGARRLDRLEPDCRAAEPY